MEAPERLMGGQRESPQWPAELLPVAAIKEVRMVHPVWPLPLRTVESRVAEKLPS